MRLPPTSQNCKAVRNLVTSIQWHIRSLIPIFCNVIEVEFDDWPQCISDITRVVLFEKEICPGDKCIRSQGGPI